MGESTPVILCRKTHTCKKEMEYAEQHWDDIFCQLSHDLSNRTNKHYYFFINKNTHFIEKN